MWTAMTWQNVHSDAPAAKSPVIQHIYASHMISYCTCLKPFLCRFTTRSTTPQEIVSLSHFSTSREIAAQRPIQMLNRYEPRREIIRMT